MRTAFELSASRVRLGCTVQARGWWTACSCFKRSRATWVYICVVEISEWPNNSCTTRKSAPWLSRWVAKAWRRVWGERGPSMPALAACFLISTQNIWRVMTAPGRDEQRVVDLAVEDLRTGAGQVAAQPGPRFVAEGHQPGLAALARDAQHALVQAQLDELEADQFRHPQAARIHQLQHGALTQAQRGVDIGRGQQRFHLAFRQGVDKALGLAGGGQFQAGVGSHLVVAQGQLIKTLEHGQAAVDGAGLGLFVAFRKIGAQVGRRDRVQAVAAGAAGGQPAGEQAHVAAVGFQRGLGQALLQPQIVAKGIDQRQIGAGRGRAFQLVGRQGAAHPHMTCCCQGVPLSTAPSWVSSQRLTLRWKPFSSSWLEKPPRPPAAVTRWQGMTSGNQLAPQAWPTARGAEPMAAATWP